MSNTRTSVVVIMALSLGACAFGLNTEPHARGSLIPSIAQQSGAPSGSSHPPATVESIKEEVDRIGAEEGGLTKVFEVKGSSDRRGTVTLTGLFFRGTLQKVLVEQSRTTAFSSRTFDIQTDGTLRNHELEHSGIVPVTEQTYDSLVDGTPPETYYFDTNGRLLLARTWGSRWRGSGSDWVLQTVDYYYDGERPLARFIGGEKAVTINYNYETDATEVRKEIDSLVRSLEPATVRRDTKP